MGIPLGGSGDLADVQDAADLTNVGDVTPWAQVRGTFNVILTGVAGTAVVDCSADGGVTSAACGILGNVVTLNGPIREQMLSRELGLLHRIRKTGGAGVMHARISQ